MEELHLHDAAGVAVIALALLALRAVAAALEASLVALGLSLGLALSAGLSSLLRSLLLGLSPWDPVAFAGVAIVLVGAAFMACALPAQRATRVDPLTALRHE